MLKSISSAVIAISLSACSPAKEQPVVVDTVADQLLTEKFAKTVVNGEDIQIPGDSYSGNDHLGDVISDTNYLYAWSNLKRKILYVDCLNTAIPSASKEARTFACDGTHENLTNRLPSSKYATSGPVLTKNETKHLKFYGHDIDAVSAAKRFRISNESAFTRHLATPKNLDALYRSLKPLLIANYNLGKIPKTESLEILDITSLMIARYQTESGCASSFDIKGRYNPKNDDGSEKHVAVASITNEFGNASCARVLSELVAVFNPNEYNMSELRDKTGSIIVHTAGLQAHFKAEHLDSVRRISDRQRRFERKLGDIYLFIGRRDQDGGDELLAQYKQIADDLLATLREQ